jgi:hypothetical protein
MRESAVVNRWTGSQAAHATARRRKTEHRTASQETEQRHDHPTTSRKSRHTSSVAIKAPSACAGHPILPREGSREAEPVAPTAAAEAWAA